jgi:hypothetical protein
MLQEILWEVDSYSACQTIAYFLFGTRRFITVFTKACHRSLSWASRIQFASSVPISLRTYALVFPVVSSLRSSQPKPCKHLPPPPCVPLHTPWFNHPHSIRLRIHAVKFSIMKFFPRSVSLPFGSKYLLCSQEPLVCVPPSKWETKFRIHTVWLAKLQFYIF